MGNDANKGTRDSPWKTIQKLNSINLEEGGTFISGAAILFMVL